MFPEGVGVWVGIVTGIRIVAPDALAVKERLQLSKLSFQHISLLLDEIGNFLQIYDLYSLCEHVGNG